MKPKTLDGLVLAYGIFLILMGAIGYFVGHHWQSFAGGGTAGVLVLIFLAVTAKNRQVGRIGVAVVSLLMFLMFAGTIARSLTATTPSTTPVWQAYVIAPVSIIVFLALGLGHMSAMKAKRLE